MSRTARLATVAGAGTVAAAALELARPDTGLAALAILAAALVAGELIEIRPVDRPPLPLSFAIVVVLLRAASPGEFMIVVSVAYLAAVCVRPGPNRPIERGQLFIERVAGAVIAGFVYTAVLDLAEGGNQRAAVLGALAAAALTGVAIHEFVTVMHSGRFGVVQDAGADVALVTSGILMSVGYRGIGGDGELGLWGVLLFSVPLLAAWYSFELLASTQRNFRQTVHALGIAPELGGFVRPGHVERVAELAVAIGRELDFSSADLEHLETAALLHHLGAVCLDAPTAGVSQDPVAVAQAGAQMLRASEVLSPAGDIVAAEPLLHRPPEVRAISPAALGGQVLKAASAFDELTEGDEEHAAWAVEALFTGPSYVYDGRVLDALERVVVRRGLLTL